MYFFKYYICILCLGKIISTLCVLTFTVVLSQTWKKSDVDEIFRREKSKQSICQSKCKQPGLGRENRTLDLEKGGKTELRQGRENNEEGDKDCRGKFFYLRKHLSDQFLFVQADSDNQQRDQNRLFVIRNAEYNISA